MAKCPNCKKNIGCSCKLRTTKTGKKGCTTCVSTLENKRIIKTSNPASPKINKVTTRRIS
jgi:hypothetical protein|tara:strand:- start:12138 stop:12317 length:180 start_codon:yes stop_codon:yes gene_type:complete